LLAHLLSCIEKIEFAFDAIDYTFSPEMNENNNSKLVRKRKKKISYENMVEVPITYI
jgi:hypothetical protein